MSGAQGAIPGANARRIGRVLVITIDRPDVRNAVDAATAFAIDAFVIEAEADSEIGAIVITGAGDKAFSSGMDLKEAAERGTGHGLVPGRGFCGITERSISKPVIAAVNGTAVAGGLELVLACDLVIASEQAVFGLPEVKRGLVALTGGVQRLARQLPRAAALEIILCGTTVTAQRMHELGVVNRVVPANMVLDEALAMAEAMLDNSWHAIRHAKALHDRSREMSLEDSLAFGRTLYDEILHSADSIEGVRAYAEKRDAKFGRDG